MPVVAPARTRTRISGVASHATVASASGASVGAVNASAYAPSTSGPVRSAPAGSGPWLPFMTAVHGCRS
ncbi:hypothetical protein FHS42_002628 [Streptomyces zagrosensis]|uniref:Uncharacterized protein n=1 Tax=Streptomyces zagrosensis TaxID=1042984 RepID=A0A7W9UYP5_9ACTN|nr:hypothetical protein [Streptomyces zagrosensis]